LRERPRIAQFDPGRRGLEMIGTNHSRLVPYGKFGTGYAHSWASAAGFGALAGDPAILFGDGLKTYITRHLGIDTQFTVDRTVGNNGGTWTEAITVGFFGQLPTREWLGEKPAV
jgi:hypothetical protein